MAADAMTTVDAIHGTYRTANDRDTKQAWLRQAADDPLTRTWAGQTEAPSITFTTTGRGTCRIGRLRGTIQLQFGPRPMTDTTLALTFGHVMRILGWPAGSRKASGLVHDADMLMLATAALRTHDPARAKEFWQLLKELKLPTSTPTTGWDPEGWAP